MEEVTHFALGLRRTRRFEQLADLKQFASDPGPA
jgi:hypothetical protein